MKSYYLINDDADLLSSYDLPELQIYGHMLGYLLRMGKKEGVTPVEDWGKVKYLMARVTNHISFHARGVKPSEVTVEFYSPEVKRLFHAVYGDGNATWTKEWLDTFESVKDAIDRQVDDSRAMCQYAAASGKRCDNCQCPDPLSEKAKEWAARVEWDTAWERMMKRNEGAGHGVDAEKPRFVVEGIINRHCHGGYRIYDTHKELAELYTEAYETAVTIAELLNLTLPG